MKQTLRSICGYVDRLGFDPLTGAANLRGVPNFVADRQAFKHANTESELWPIGDLSPCLKDRFDQSGAASDHCVHQDLLLARRVHARSPRSTWTWARASTASSRTSPASGRLKCSTSVAVAGEGHRACKPDGALAPSHGRAVLT